MGVSIYICFISELVDPRIDEAPHMYRDHFHSIFTVTDNYQDNACIEASGIIHSNLPNTTL